MIHLSSTTGLVTELTLLRTTCESVPAFLQRSRFGASYDDGHALKGFWYSLQYLLAPAIVANPLLRAHPGAERTKAPACDTGLHCRGCSIPRVQRYNGTRVHSQPYHEKCRGLCLFMNITTWWMVTRVMCRMCHSTFDGFRTLVICLGSQGGGGSPQPKSSRIQW